MSHILFVICQDASPAHIIHNNHFTSFVIKYKGHLILYIALVRHQYSIENSGE